MEMKAKEQDSLGQKMFLQQLSTPCFHGAVVEVAVPGSVPPDDGGIHNCQQGLTSDFRVSKELGL